MVRSLLKTESAVADLIRATLLQFAGTTAVGLFLGQTPSWVCSASAFPALALAFVFQRFAPPRVVEAVDNSKLFKPLVHAGNWISSSHAITSWGAEKALTANFSRARQSPLVFLFCGFLASCTGTVIKDWLQLESRDQMWSLKPGGPSLHAKRRIIARGLVLTSLYYCLRNPHSILNWRAVASPHAKSIVAVGIILNACRGLLQRKVKLE